MTEGFVFAAVAALSASSAFAGVPSETLLKWTLPDGKIVSGEEEGPQ